MEAKDPTMHCRQTIILLRYETRHVTRKQKNYRHDADEVYGDGLYGL